MIATTTKQEAHPEMDFTHLQDALGNIPMVKNYMVLSLFFTLSDAEALSKAQGTIRLGLDKLSTILPHLRGHVVYDGKTEADAGVVKIYPSDDPISLTIRDLRQRNDFPSMETIRNAKYPLSMLDGQMLVPYDLIPPSFESIYQESQLKLARLLFVQANLVSGGIILTFAANHTTMDMNGLGQTVDLFAKACREERFSDDEIKRANVPRRNAIPLLGDEYQPGPEAEYFLQKEKNSWTDQGDTNQDKTTSPPICSIFTFTPDTLSQLKRQASQQQLVPYISTNDAVTAFLWQRITKARLPRLNTIQLTTTMVRQVDARRHFGLDKLYLGHMATSAYDTVTNVWDKPLGEISAQLRQRLSHPDVPFHLRAIATLLYRPDYRARIAYAANLDFDHDVVISSWSDVKCCQTSFGDVLGIPDAALRPRIAAFGGGAFIMPFTKTGDLPVCVGLREDDMQRLRDDVEFTKYAEYIG